MITAWFAGALQRCPGRLCAGLRFILQAVRPIGDTLGYTADGLQALAEAHTLVEQHEERWWEAEVCRLRGVLLLRQTMPPPEEAKALLEELAG